MESGESSELSREKLCQAFSDVESYLSLNQTMTRDGKCILLAPAGVSVAQLIQLYQSVVIQDENTSPATLETLVNSCSKWQETKNAGDTLKITQSVLIELFSPVLQKYGLTPQTTLKEGLMIIFEIISEVLASQVNSNVASALSGVFVERVNGFSSESVEDPLFYRTWHYLSALMKIATEFSSKQIPEDLPSIKAAFGDGKISKLIFETLVCPSHITHI
jgi:hypothetical protein